MKKRLLKSALILASLAAMGVGLWWIYPPLCPLVLGGLGWLDLSLASHLERARRPAPARLVPSPLNREGEPR